jgi:cold shock CspA family protein
VRAARDFAAREPKFATEMGVMALGRLLSGFIAPDQGGKDIFVHASALERAGIMGLAEGQRVAIDVAQGQKGPEAVGLRLI